MAQESELKKLRTFGIELVDAVPWGTHLCQFYESKQDLIDILVPYFAEGLHSNEFCMWVTSPPLDVEEAAEALRKAVPDLDEYFRKGQIEIISYDDWYLLGGKFDSTRVLQGWVEKENSALERGFEGLRLTGNTFWIERDLWKSFVDYEEAVNAVIGQHKMIAVCTYCLTRCTGTDVLDVVRNHVGTLVKQEDKWYHVEDASRRKAANGALKLSEQKYSALFENMQDGFAYHKIILNEKGKPIDYVFLEVNKALEQLTGLKREKVLGKAVTKVLPGIENDPADWIGVYGKVALTGEPSKFENYAEALNKWYMVSAYSPEKGFFAVTFEDITERKKFEQALMRVKSEWERTFDSVPDLIAILDDKHRIVRANKAMAEKLGTTPDQCLGLKCYKCVHGTSGPPEFCPHAQTLQDGQEHVAELFEDRLGGYFVVSTTPLRDEQGRMIGSVHVARDITERKLAEDEIKRLNAFQKKVFESINDELMVIDLSDFTILAANNTLFDNAKMPEKDVIGKHCYAITHHNSDRCSPPDHACPITEMLRTGEPIVVEHTHYDKEGNEYYVEVSASPVMDGEGNIIQAVHLARDITQRKRAEKALREREQRWATTLSSIGDAVIAADVDGKVTFINAVAEELTGWKLSEAKHKLIEEVFNIVNEQTRSKVENPVSRVLKEGMIVGLANHTILLRKDGTEIPIDDSGAPIKDEDGNIIGVVLVFRDITKRRKEEEILREQSLIISSASDAIFSTDNSFIFKSWNKSAEQIFGWAAEEVIGKASNSIFDAVYPALDGTTREQALEHLMNRGYWKGEIIYHKKDGSPIPVSSSAGLVKDKDGNVTGVVAVVHDITARKKREEKLREAQRDLNHAQAVAKTGSWRLDVKHNVLLWSDETYRMFGVPKGTPLTYETFLDTIHPDDRAEVDQRWQAALRGEHYDIEHRIIVNGEIRWVREKAELEFNEDGVLRGGFGTVQDVTEAVMMRQKLEDSRVQLEEYSCQMEQLASERAEKLKDAERLAAIGATAGMVGHDIRNPLQAIVGNLYLVKSDLALLPESEEKQNMKESIDDVAKNVEYINKIVQDLQDYARPIKPAVQETNFEELCIEVLFKNGVPEKIDASYQVAKEAQTFNADPALLKRILNNLTNNAIQAMEEEGGKLEINAYKDKNDFIITVHDNGVGIPEEVKPNIFTPLFTTKSKGQGFGLAVVKRMTEALGGTVTFESKEGTGTTFTVRIPQKTKNNK